jgi:hypothetical protein
MTRSRTRVVALSSLLSPLTVAGGDHERVVKAFTQTSAIDAIERYVILSSVLDATREHVRSRGTVGEEAALCWAGTVQGRSAIITTALVFASAGRQGHTQITAAATGLLYAHCHARGLTLLAQVHSHPADAFHSAIDERLPHSAERGFLSLVVPNLGACSFVEFDSWCVFEQVRYEIWREWPADEKRRRLTILDSVIGIQ